MKKLLKPGRLALIFGILVLIGVFAYYYFQVNNPHRVRVFFFKGEMLQSVDRPLLNTEDPLMVAARELILGPTATELQQGFMTEIPKKARVLSVRKQGSTAAIDFSPELQNYGGGSARVRGLIAQIVFTLSDVHGVKQVKILVSGRNEVVLGGEGLMIDRPLSREDLRF